MDNSPPKEEEHLSEGGSPNSRGTYTKVVGLILIIVIVLAMFYLAKLWRNPVQTPSLSSSTQNL